MRGRRGGGGEGGCRLGGYDQGVGAAGCEFSVVN